jgi:hypothetical protein
MTASVEPVCAERAQRRRYPDFFIVGHAKCGTTALYEMLRCHPQIYMPSVKEPQFFARNPSPVPAEARVKSFEQTGRYGESVDEYLSLFAAARPEQRVGEASTFYLWSPDAAARIAAAQPQARIIAVLREPASFLRSLHLQMVQNQTETEKDLRRAIALEAERRRGRRIPRNAHWPRALVYTDRVRYVEQLRRFHMAFPREQVLVLIYDDFRADNEATVRRVLRFLEVDDSVALELLQANPTVEVRSVRLDTVLRTVKAGRGPVSRAVRGALRGLTTGRLRRQVIYPMRRRVLYGDPRPSDEAYIEELRRRFKGEVVDLSRYLDRDLVALWGYDRVG